METKWEPIETAPKDVTAWALVFPDGTIHPAWLYETKVALKDRAPGEITGEVSFWPELKKQGYKILQVSISPKGK